jgi:hypothetical protein
MIFVIPAAADAMKGNSPTAKMSCGETPVVSQRMRKGTRLAGMATSRQFNHAAVERPTIITMV